ncbi:SH3 domain-containing protein [Bacillus salitolerans]|uniref:SH3 domain-containing protein n=1 Tax=Bacillus salitolerans TaxID=1437434 RepID=A0ABW4LIR8_9BACI
MKKIILMMFVLFVIAGCMRQENSSETPNNQPTEIIQDDKDPNNETENNSSAVQEQQSNSSTEKEEPTVEDSEHTGIDTENRTIVKVPIRDESSQNPLIAKFIAELKTVIKEKNKENLLQLLSDEIKFSFGAEEIGKAGFVKKWNLDQQPENSRVWIELQDALAHGGTLHEDSYTAPYIYLNFPEGYDAFNYGAILGERVNLRTTPSLNSETILQLSYEVVEMVGEYTEETVKIDQELYHWVKVKTLDGVMGYVAGKYVRTSVDYRIGIDKDESGQLKIQFFIAGD